MKLPFHIKSTFTVSCLAVFIISVFSGCVRLRKKEVPPPPPPQYYIHEVKFPGETLAAISKWYTGDSANYTAILAANPGLEPRKIALGTSINIPYELVVKKEPFDKRAATTRGQDPKSRSNVSKNSNSNIDRSAGEDVTPSQNSAPPPPTTPGTEPSTAAAEEAPSVPFGDVNAASSPTPAEPLSAAAAAARRNAQMEEELRQLEAPTTEPTPAATKEEAQANTETPALGNANAAPQLPDAVATPAPLPSDAKQRRRSILEEMLDGK